MNDKDRQHLIQNIAGNLRNAKSAEIKARQREFFSLSYLNISSNLASRLFSFCIRCSRPGSLRCHCQRHRRADRPAAPGRTRD